MPPIYINGQEVVKRYVGIQEVVAAYVGSQQVFSGALYPLDGAGALPEYAYSTVKLTADYAGPSLRVLRPSDSAEQDIGFVGADFDQASLSAFLGSQVGRVTVFYDQTGKGNHGTQTNATYRPYINPSVKRGLLQPVAFIQQRIDLPSSVVVSRRALSYFDVTESCSSAGYGGRFQHGTGSSQVSFFELGGGFQQNPGLDTTAFKAQIRPKVLCLKLGAAGISLSYAGETNTAAAVSDVSMIGGFVCDTNLVGEFQGVVLAYAFASYGRETGVEDTETIKTQLAARFSVATASTKRVIFAGDSICGQTWGPQKFQFFGYAKQSVDLLTEPAHAYNVSGGGNTLTGTAIPNFATQITPILSRYPADNRIVFCAYGTNDLTDLGRSAAQMYADIQTYCGLVRAGGGKVIVATMLPNNGWNGTQQTTRNDFNTLVRTNWASFADGLADFALDPTMGPQAAASNITLYDDGLHITNVGASYLAPIVAAAINAL